MRFEEAYAGQDEGRPTQEEAVQLGYGRTSGAIWTASMRRRCGQELSRNLTRFGR